MGNMKPAASAATSKLIDDLGGSTAVSDLISKHFDIQPVLTPQAVSNWRRRGIPFCYRACLAIKGREAGVDVPAGFLNEGVPAMPADEGPDTLTLKKSIGNDLPGWL